MANSSYIRNFVIIAHIDHGKSTLADRMLELTGTVEKRVMRPQYLDQLELERERGITIKMAPVRMVYHSDQVEYMLNLIDTPGHSDFSYEVSRALMAVESAVLLVDATQGIQAQTLANFENAKRVGLTIIGAVNKVDIASPEQIAASVSEVAGLLKIGEGDVMKVSGKTGEGVEELLKKITERTPPPRAYDPDEKGARALVFDSLYDDHKGVLAFVRVFDGEFSAADSGAFLATGAQFKIKEIGYFAPALAQSRKLCAGEIGYVATGIKDPDKVKIGDTLVRASAFENVRVLALSGYREPKPVVFVSFYPEDPTEYENLRQALSYLRLNDAALHFEPDVSEILGRGFKGGFLGRLHFEITADRLAREFNMRTVHSFPSVEYQVRLKQNGWLTITNPKDFPADPGEVLEPMTAIEILTPAEYIGGILRLKELFRLEDIEVKTAGAKTLITAAMPLAELISDFDDKIKSLSAGFASLSYEIAGWQKAEVEKMEVLVADNVVAGLTRIIAHRDVAREARASVGKLKDLLPRQQFTQALQAAVGGNIIARETIPAMRKELGNFGKNGGDRTRKMKLWKKQQRGKARLKERGTQNQVKIPAAIFKELLKR